MKELARIIWKSPSNIAFIKYWGKYGNQYPKNPSLSMTLEKCFTQTGVRVFHKNESKDEIDFTFLFEGNEHEAFSERIRKYLGKLSSGLSILKDYKLLIESENSFPHSAGIASSASAMSALALCLASIEQRIGKGGNGDIYGYASAIARIGSGSASRSLFKKYTVWGETDIVPGTSNEFACELPFSVHPDFSCLRDTILIINKEEKKVSSSSGHSLMEGHPYAQQRFINAADNLERIVQAMRSGDFNDFATILEHEALSLHAMMMTATPWYTLLSPNTLSVIQKIRDFREETNTKVAFTLDAGPNVHVIYTAEEDRTVCSFIEKELLKYTQEGELIKDNIGWGPELIRDEFQ